MNSGKFMYTDLQWKYLSGSSATMGDTANIYDIPENIEELPSTIYTANHHAEYEDISEKEDESVCVPVRRSGAVFDRL